MIVPHLRGIGRDPSLCCSHSPQPAQLDEDTSLPGFPTLEDTTKRTAHSRNWDTHMDRDTHVRWFRTHVKLTKRAVVWATFKPYLFAMMRI